MGWRFLTLEDSVDVVLSKLSWLSDAQVLFFSSHLHANSDKTKLSNSRQAILVCVFVCRHCQYFF